MAKFRVMRGGISNGKPWAMGQTVEAETAREAVAKETKQATAQAADTCGGFFAPMKPAPIVAVYALVPVPEADWR